MTKEISHMDRQTLFDSLTVGLAEPRSRGEALRWLGRVVVALAVFGIAPWSGRAQEVGSESQLVKGCRLPGQKCNNGKQDCCSKKCTGDKRCGCVNKGGTPDVKTPLGPVPIKALCCSNKLNKRRGTCK
jgi:hypothetical protein